MIPIKKRGVETGQFALCSEEHYEELMKFNWNINIDGYVRTMMAYDIYIVHNNLITERNLNFEANIEYYKTCKPYVKQQKTRLNFIGVYKGKKDNFYIRVNNIYFSSKNDRECALKYDEIVVKYNLNKKLNFPENYPNYKVIKIIPEYFDEKTFKIKFKNGKETFISSESYDKIKYYKITVWEYVFLKIDGKNVRLSRFLMDETDPKIVIDHEDGNPLNNRLENLRRTNRKGNAENKNKKRKTKDQTNYIGVKKSGKKYILHIRCGDFKYIKTHESEEHAARDRDLQIMKNLPNSLYHLYFKDDWKIPGKIEKWESILYDDKYWIKRLFY